jgi:hypothetical protein
VDEAETEAVPAPGRSPTDDIKTFLAAISVVLRETVGGFEDTVTRVTEITAMRPGKADRELVVALQSFDRLQQEFASLGDVLAKLSALSDERSLLGEAGPTEPGYDVLSTIAIADLKDRLSRQLRSFSIDLGTNSPSTDEAVF